MSHQSSKGDILKVRLGNDLRRLVLYNTHISYDDLVLMLQRVYGGKLKSTDEVTLKYYDDDDDLITIADADDFAHAREYSSTGIVKVVIYVNGCHTGYGQLINPKDMRRELADVRNKVNSLVDSFDAMQMNLNQAHGPLDSLSASTATTVAPTQAMEGVPFITAVTEGISAFDPLKSRDHSMITTTVTTQLPVTSTISQVNATSTASGSTSHLFSGQNGGSFLDSTGTTQPQPPPQLQVPQTQLQPQPQVQIPQAATQIPQATPGQFVQQPTAPPPASTPQPSSYSTYPPQSTSQQTGYPGSSAPSQYPYQGQSQYPTSTGNQYPPQQPQANTSYNPYGPGAPYQPPTGSYQPPQGGRGYPTGPSRNSPYRVGY